MTIPDYAERHWSRESRGRGVEGSTSALANDLANHLRRWRGAVPLKSLTAELCQEFRDYFLDLVPHELKERTANKYLRVLRAIGNHAAKQGLLRKVIFNNWFPEPELEPQAWTPEELRRILQAARNVPGSVGKKAKNGYEIPAAVWWYAWARAIMFLGCRVTAMMKAERGDFQNGVFWLKRKNQKQKRDQKIELPRRSCAAIEDLLALHDRRGSSPGPSTPQSPASGPPGKRSSSTSKST